MHIHIVYSPLLTGIVTAVLISVMITSIIIPKILQIAFRKKLFDRPDERKLHTERIPRLGGIAFVPSLIFAVCALFGIYNLPLRTPDVLTVMQPADVRAICFGTCGLILLYLVGLADDFVGVRYRFKLLVQTLAAVLLIFGGVNLSNLHGFCAIYAWPQWCGCILTVLATLLCVNAINLIDGLDGLASGLSCLALLVYGATFAYTGKLTNAVISFALLGTLVQFFYYNVFGKASQGKKIFMGDSGALCVGFVLTYLAISIAQMPAIGGSAFNPIVVAFSPLLLPCFDALRVVGGRLLRGSSPFLPDKSHIHHMLLRRGLSPAAALVCIMFVASLLVGIDVALSPRFNATLLLILDAGICALGILALRHRERA